MQVSKAWARMGPAAAAVLCLPLAGSVAHAAPTASASQTLNGQAPVVHVSDADSGRTYHVQRGTRLEVDLKPNLGSYHVPVADKPAVLREDRHQGGYPAATNAVAWFTAVGTGSAAITSQTDAGCLHSTPRCMIAQRLFRVTFEVTDDAPARSVTVDERQNGRTVTVHRGQRLRLELHSTYWTIDPATGAALSTVGAQQTSAAAAGCIPGGGCGTVARTFRAVHQGTAHVAATRTTCGEAMRCSPMQSSFRLTVRVVR